MKCKLEGIIIRMRVTTIKSPALEMKFKGTEIQYQVGTIISKVITYMLMDKITLFLATIIL